MKALRTLVLAALIVPAGHMTAQISILAGLGFSFGTTAEAVGIHIRGDVDIDDTPYGGSLNFISYFSPATGPDNIDDVTAVYRETNFDGHYFLVEGDQLRIYGLAGINISTAGAKIKVNAPFIPNINETETQIGLNVGGGARFPLTDQISLVGEIKYILSKFDQLVISAAGVYAF
ncbi:MAG: outer membrane beta-barrel protein [Saprospiraceae bacterium]|nr:outer membrane beta-barrel protein [Saprospiraceae bacterium]